jgi:hypothetical protein
MGHPDAASRHRVMTDFISNLPREACLNWNGWMRQIHRWVSMLFVAVVAGIFILLGLGKTPVPWVYFLPLFPLALLVLTGLYMFVLPYVARRRGA